MKIVVIATVAAAVAAFAQFHISRQVWAPEPAKAWNWLALNGSGFGRALSRAGVGKADESWHHGLVFSRPDRAYNPFSKWLDAGMNSLGFAGRLAYRPVAIYPVRPFEVREVLRITERRLRTAFDLDRGNYRAFAAYLFFLNYEVKESEFGRAEPSDRRQPGKTGGPSTAPGRTVRTNGTRDGEVDEDDDFEAAGSLQPWTGANRQQRLLRAFAITNQALESVTDKDQDPERHLNRAMVIYDRFMLLAPSVENREGSLFARCLFETQATEALSQMRLELGKAQLCLEHQLQSGVWKRRSAARQGDFWRWAREAGRYARTLQEIIRSNRRL
ncbi:MAG: hypothetical protein JOY92_12890 [Verrucomicrobia bacterium]|nr:hypothetical protein [Verrucomicrobiota bacterium]